MLVKGIVPRGYCKGVVRAIEIAKKQAHQTAPVYILGMIVHNQYIVNALEDLGIQTIDRKGKTRLELLDEIDHGKVIITAHGASQKVFDKAKEKGLEVIDASCLDVIKTHDLIQDKLNEGYDYVVGSRFKDIGKPWSLRMLGSRILSSFIYLKTGRLMTDPTSGMRAIGKNVVREFSRNLNFIAEPDALTYILRRKYKVVEVQVSMDDRENGVSYFANPLRSIKFMFNSIISILFLQ